MSGSGTIRIVKRDGTQEPFDAGKLATSMFQGMRQTSGRYCDAWQLAEAIESHLRRRKNRRTSSDAVFEMAVEVLRRSGFTTAGYVLQAHRSWRLLRRQRLQVRHEGGRATLWDKSWLSQLAQGSWFLAPTTGRILAGQIEQILLAAEIKVVPRQDVVEMLNELVVQYGLADAVPVRIPANS